MVEAPVALVKGALGGGPVLVVRLRTNLRAGEEGKGVECYVTCIHIPVYIYIYTYMYS